MFCKVLGGSSRLICVVQQPDDIRNTDARNRKSFLTEKCDDRNMQAYRFTSGNEPIFLSSHFSVLKLL